MTQEQNLKPARKVRHISPLVYRLFYGAFIALGIYYIFFSKDFMSGVNTLGLALIFDPFDETVKWNNRPAYQKVWLFVHVFIVMGLFIYAFFIK